VFNQSQAPRIEGIIRLVEQIPGELLICPSENYSEFMVALGAISHFLTAISSHGKAKLEPIRDFGPLDPIFLIRRCLQLCPDEFPVPSTSELAFITDEDLRLSIRIDISTATKALSNAEWKATTVFAGAAIEALLLWALQNITNQTNI
jgi:hypothetical protein